MGRFRIASGILSGLLTLPVAFADDRALLIGVGEYELESARLPGIGHDIAVMQDLVAELGFDENRIMVLQDSRATLSQIRIAVQRHLMHGVDANDRVLLYFSGHGTQVPDLDGDEVDGADETLLPFDARLVTSNGRQRLVNVLTDDELNTMLSAIPAGEIIVIIDACHSGTVTKALFDPDNPDSYASVPKSFIYEGMPDTGDTILKTLNISDETFNYVGLSAAADNELAIATERGSLFTNALNAELRLTQETQSISVNELASRVADRIRNVVKPERVFTPQLSGDLEQAKNIRFRTVR